MPSARMPRLALSSSTLLRAALRPSSSASSSSNSGSQFLPRCVAATTRARSFSHLPNLRPKLQSQSHTASLPSVFRPPTLCSPSFGPSIIDSASASASGVVADVVRPSAISSHPAFCGAAAQQIRCGPRPTMSGHSRLIQKRRHGFLSRAKTKNGVKTLKRRRAKGRKRLSA